MGWVKIFLVGLGVLSASSVQAVTCKMVRHYNCKGGLIIGGVNVVVGVWTAEVSCQTGQVLSQSFGRLHQSRCSEVDYDRVAYWSYSARYSCAEIGAAPKATGYAVIPTNTYTINYTSTRNFVAHSCAINQPQWFAF